MTGRFATHFAFPLFGVLALTSFCAVTGTGTRRWNPRADIAASPINAVAKGSGRRLRETRPGIDRALPGCVGGRGGGLRASLRLRQRIRLRGDGPPLSSTGRWCSTANWTPTRPEIVIYEPMPNGRLKMTGADYLVIAETWDAKHPGVTPRAHGTALSSVRKPQSLRAPGVLHAACLGLEGQPQRHVRELAPQRVV